MLKIPALVCTRNKSSNMQELIKDRLITAFSQEIVVPFYSLYSIYRRTHKFNVKKKTLQKHPSRTEQYKIVCTRKHTTAEESCINFFVLKESSFLQLACRLCENRAFQGYEYIIISYLIELVFIIARKSLPRNHVVPGFHGHNMSEET